MRACTHYEINHTPQYRRGQLIRGEPKAVPLMRGKLVEVGIGDYLGKPREPSAGDDLFDIESRECDSGASHTNLVSIVESDDEAVHSRINSDSSFAVPGDEAAAAPKVSPISTRYHGDRFKTTTRRPPVLQDQKWDVSSLEEMMILALRTLDGEDGRLSPRSVDSSEEITYVNACSHSMFSCCDGDSIEDDDDFIVIHCVIWKRIGGLSFNHLSNTSTKTFGVCSQDLSCLKRLGVIIDEDLDPNSFRVMDFSVRIFRHRVVSVLFKSHAEFEVQISGGGRTWSRWTRYSAFKPLARETSRDPCAHLVWTSIKKQMPGHRCLLPDYLSRKCYLLERFLEEALFALPSPVPLLELINS